MPTIDVFIWRSENLQQTRQRVQAGENRLQPALAALCEEADATLALTPPAVTDKQRIPPSGDKHDYLSLAPYWWPDPQAPDGLPYIRRDGEVNPESLHDSDRHPMEAMMHAVETLALAAYFTDSRPYADQAAALLHHWFLAPQTCMHPHLQFGQAIPGVTEGRDIGIIDTRNLSTLVDAITLLLHATSALPTEDYHGLLTWMRTYLDWLLTSDHGKGEASQHNNHGTWYDVQVAALALFVGDTEVARQVLAASAPARITAHIAADGSQPHELARTLSWDYSVMNLEGLSRLAELGRHVGLDLWHYTAPAGGSLHAAIDFLAPYADPARNWPYPQLKTVNRLVALPYHLRRATLIFDDARYAACLAQLPADEVARHRVQLLYPHG